MKLFVVGLLILLTGYFIYGKVIEKIFAPDDREVPATKYRDDLDYLVLPDWKNKLIQLLNIAGVGPVIGVIIGIKFGDIVFLLIPIGCILAGAVHDFTAGMMSLRNKGANLTGLVKLTAGKKLHLFFALFLCIALLLVVAVFITTPAQLLAGLLHFKYALLASIIAIFIYYIAATLFPVDKIIGKIYPIFGGLLLLGTLALFGSLIWRALHTPAILAESPEFAAGKFTAPIIPMLFVTIACGILSGFHATQAPIVARTISSERQAKGVFFGMMVLEGFIAMVWAAGALAVYNKAPEFMGKNATAVLHRITGEFLGSGLSLVVVLSVIVLAVTSGDTAMRSLRLSLAEMFNIDQKPVAKRLLVVFPLIAVVSGLLVWSSVDNKSFQMLWIYFVWSNQVIAVFTFLCGTIYLASKEKPVIVTALPGMFITFVVTSYILWISPAHGGPLGFGLDLFDAYMVAGFVSVLLFIWAIMRGRDNIGKFEEQ
ncbi:MAG: carbon starvation protein A [Lentisphaeria bacterium]|nr:carbon starvation protein A [Lentisphaeria bacterium]